MGFLSSATPVILSGKEAAFFVGSKIREPLYTITVLDKDSEKKESLISWVSRFISLLLI